MNKDSDLDQCITGCLPLTSHREICEETTRRLQALIRFSLMVATQQNDRGWCAHCIRKYIEDCAI